MTKDREGYRKRRKKEMQYYRPEKINENITVLRSMCGELLYLIEGGEKAILIDTGEGVGHLRRLVE